MNDIRANEAIEILSHYTDLGYGIIIEGDDVSKIVQALSLACKILTFGIFHNPVSVLTEEEKKICKMYLEDLDKTHTCNEYKILMSIIDSATSESGNTQADLIEYKPLDADFNTQSAVKNLRTAYWSNETAKFAKAFTEAEDIIISAICHGGYTVCKETVEGDLISREAFRKHYCKINCGERQCVDHADRCSFIDELMQFKTEPERPQYNQIAWEQGYEAGLAQGKHDRLQGEYIRKEDVIALLNKWADGYSYIEIPTEDAIKAIMEFNPSSYAENGGK